MDAHEEYNRKYEASEDAVIANVAITLGGDQSYHIVVFGYASDMYTALVLRAYWWGVGSDMLAEFSGKSYAAVYRAVWDFIHDIDYPVVSSLIGRQKDLEADLPEEDENDLPC